jgi:hypothetical protein
MSAIYVRHKNVPGRVLVCDSDYRPLSEEISAQYKPRNKAFYTACAAGFIGVYSSSRGPVLFINERKFLFADAAWSVSVQKGGATNRVTFTGLEQEPLTFDVPVTELDPLDPWSEEQFDDFFLWLETKRSDRELIAMWTDKS